MNRISRAKPSLIVVALWSKNRLTCSTLTPGRGGGMTRVSTTKIRPNSV
jgi:hypothetical protein